MSSDRLIQVIDEPDSVLRSELEALFSDVLLEDSDEITPVAVIGPNADLEALRVRHAEGYGTLVLGDASRQVEALRAGASEVSDWPVDGDVLVARAHKCGLRRSTEHHLSVERRDLSALIDLSEALSSTSDVEATLFQIAKRMAEVMGSDRCSIVLLDHEHERGVVVADSADESVRNHPISVADRYPEIVEVVKTGAPLVIDDVRSAALFDEVREIIRDKPFGSTALFPVTADARVQGVMMCRGADIRTSGLSLRQIRFGTIVANATSIAIRNARMYQSIRERTERVLSARIRAGRRLRQLEKYQRFFDLAGDGLTIVDGRGQIVFANKMAQNILGFSAEDITQIRFQDIAQPDSLDVVHELIAAFREGRQQRRVDLPIIRANGDPAILSLSTASLDPEATRLQASSDRWSQSAAIISIRDVTETVLMQDELTKTKDFLENVIQSSADAIVAADTRGRILIFNHVAERITGYRSEDVVGRMPVARLYPEGVAQLIMSRLRSEQHGEVGKYEGGRHELLTVDGVRVPISLSAALIEDQGKPIASVGIFSDLRERIRMEEALASAQKRLELNERQAAVVELAGTAAHELSQPLTTILGSAELLARKIEGETPARKQVDRILSECDRMVEMLKKFGEIRKYETKPYLGATKILDLDAASDHEESP